MSFSGADSEESKYFRPWHHAVCLLREVLSGIRLCTLIFYSFVPFFNGRGCRRGKQGRPGTYIKVTALQYTVHWTAGRRKLVYSAFFLFLQLLRKNNKSSEFWNKICNFINSISVTKSNPIPSPFANCLILTLKTLLSLSRSKYFTRQAVDQQAQRMAAGFVSWVTHNSPLAFFLTDSFLVDFGLQTKITTRKEHTTIA